MKASELCAVARVEFTGPDVEISQVRPVMGAGDGDLIFSRHDTAYAPDGALLVVGPDAEVSGPGAVVRHPQPRLLWGILARVLRPVPGQDRLVHPSAVIADHVTIRPPVRIGPGAVIGEPGFGWDQDGAGWTRVPHYGSVFIGEKVTIGANTCIDRGVMSDTIIGPGCHIDNLVHVAHNAVLAQNVMVVAGVVIGGSVHVGGWSWIGMGARIAEGVEIGWRAFIGAGAIITRDVDDDEAVVGVNRRIDLDPSVRPRLGYRP